MGIFNFFAKLVGLKPRAVSGPSAPAESPQLKQNQPGEELRDVDKTGLGWNLAPKESHVEAFRFYDARKYRLLLRTSGKSEIHVRFKTKAEYAYYSPSHDQFVLIYKKLLADRHPGKVIWALLRGKFQYRQLVAAKVKWKPPKSSKRKYHSKRHGGRKSRRG